MSPKIHNPAAGGKTLAELDDRWLNLDGESINVTNGTFDLNTTGQITTSGRISSTDGTRAERFGANAVASANDSTAVGENSAATGVNSLALGADSVASAQNTTALGKGSQATNTNSLALGAGILATQIYAIGIGTSVTSSGVGSVAVGWVTTSNQTAFAIGALSNATGVQSAALGIAANALGASSFALGTGSTANNTGSLAFGASALSSGANAVAMGTSASVKYSESMGIGAGATTTKANQLVIGSDTQPITEVLVGNDVTFSDPQAQTLFTVTSASGSNKSGTAYVIQPGAGTGTGEGGNFIVKTATPGAASNATLNAYTTAFTIDDSQTTQTHAGRIANTTRYTSSQTALVTDEVLFCDTDGGAWTLTLPAGVEGTHYKIINCGSGGYDLTVDGDSAETIYGETTQDLADGEVIDIHYNATEGWW